MGKDYMEIFNGVEKIVPKNCEILKAKGRIGQKLKVTKNWLTKVQ
jgi:hypothetical protein